MSRVNDGLPLNPELLRAVLRPRVEACPLPPQAYNDPAVLAWELRHLFEEAWVCIGREDEGPREREVTTTTVGEESVLLTRDEEGLRAFFNVCQHRGTRLVTEPRLEAERLICPYHSWTYDLRGRLRAAQHMSEARHFDRRGQGLVPIRLESMEGWVFVNVSGSAGSLASFLGNLPVHLARHRPGGLRLAQRMEYEVAANWKILSENYQECYHCPTIHPELSRVTPYRSGRYDDSIGPWMGGPMELMPGCTTMSLTGVSARGPLPGLRQEDTALVYYYSVLPNLWISLHPDYVMTHTVWPLDVDRTRIVCEWLFDPEVCSREDFDASDAVEFWDLVNRQDWQACERVQLGVGSRGFRGGRFSDEEDGVHRLSSLLASSYLQGRPARSEELPTG